MFGNKPKGGYGLQITDEELRIINLAATSRGVKLKLHHSEPLILSSVRDGRILDEDAVAGKLRFVAARLGLQGAKVHLSIPTSSTVLRKSVFPVMNDKELRNMIDVELNSGTTMPFKEPVFDYLRLGPAVNEEVAAAAQQPKSKGRKQEEVLIIASPSNVVESYVRVVEQAGMKPATIELAPFASLRLLLAYAGQINQPLSDRIIVLNAENGHLEFSIFVDGVPVFLHTVAELSAMDAYAGAATELSRILYYFTYTISATQEKIKEIYVLGASDWVENMPAKINEVFDGSVYTIPMDQWFMEPNDVIQSYAVPIGLALRGA
ncbi:type IV pilus biogenesis protein PilM [Cohnella yongneupensis]|uniref:Type IV pilus biogenesis protein PilM n=1 Tax=Cohnella yongneupensis TaxID=425006 RepID=A0ABW0R1W4_9BACL